MSQLLRVVEPGLNPSRPMLKNFTEHKATLLIQGTQGVSGLGIVHIIPNKQ